MVYAKLLRSQAEKSQAAALKVPHLPIASKKWKHPTLIHVFVVDIINIRTKLALQPKSSEDSKRKVKRFPSNVDVWVALCFSAFSIKTT
jgi:hypothetical protein